MLHSINMQNHKLYLAVISNQYEYYTLKWSTQFSQNTVKPKYFAHLQHSKQPIYACESIFFNPCSRHFSVCNVCVN
jgi:hypothetical protein